jgi:hypothetical protein
MLKQLAVWTGYCNRLHRVEIAIQGMLVHSLGNNLVEDRKLHIVIGSGARFSVTGWPRVLMVEVIAGKAEHCEFTFRIGAMQ